jgi:hypothetical protein
MKATKLAAGTAVLAAAVVGRGVGPAATDERVCRGTIGAVTVNNLRAPRKGQPAGSRARGTPTSSARRTGPPPPAAATSSKGTRKTSALGSSRLTRAR